MEELGSLETPHFVRIHHNIDTSNSLLSKVDQDNSLENKNSKLKDASNALEESNEVVKDLDALRINLMQGDDPLVNGGVEDEEDRPRGTKKKWSYNNPYNNHPQTYYNANGHRKEYYHYAGNVVRVQSDEKSREKSRNRGNGRRKGGKGRNKGKGKNKSRNKVNIIDSEQADSADLGNLKYKEELTNSVLEEDLKSKGEVALPAKPVEFEDCDNLRCRNGGRCVVDELRGGVRCQCNLGTEGKFCENGE